jgi:ribonucleotide monophosphatase NagD (HAD superfamily)
MNIEEYNIIQIKENNNQIAIDFDGVIHKNSKGFYDGTVYDPPIEGAIETIKKLSEKYTIVIFTAKVKPDRPLVNGKTGTQLVEEWLKKYDVFQYVDYVTAEKPRAILYIDDNGYRHTNWVDTLKFMESYE